MISFSIYFWSGNVITHITNIDFFYIFDNNHYKPKKKKSTTKKKFINRDFRLDFLSMCIANWFVDVGVLLLVVVFDLCCQWFLFFFPIHFWVRLFHYYIQFIDLIIIVDNHQIQTQQFAHTHTHILGIFDWQIIFFRSPGQQVNSIFFSLLPIFSYINVERNFPSYHPQV